MSEFTQHWETYTKGILYPSAVEYIKHFFEQNRIIAPTLGDFNLITWEEMLNSDYPISIESMKSILVFQQNISNGTIED